MNKGYRSGPSVALIPLPAWQGLFLLRSSGKRVLIFWAVAQRVEHQAFYL